MNDRSFLIEVKRYKYHFIFLLLYEAFLLISNVIPLFPVSGIMARTPKGLSCSRTSVRYILNTILLVLGVFEMILTARLVMKLGDFVPVSITLC